MKSKYGGNVNMEEIAVLMKHSPKLDFFLVDDQDNADELL